MDATSSLLSVRASVESTESASLSTASEFTHGFRFGSLPRPPESCLISCSCRNSTILVCLWPHIASANLSVAAVDAGLRRLEVRYFHRQGKNLNFVVDSYCLDLCGDSFYGSLLLDYLACGIDDMMLMSFGGLHMIAPPYGDSLIGFFAFEDAELVQRLSLFVWFSIIGVAMTLRDIVYHSLSLSFLYGELHNFIQSQLLLLLLYAHVLPLVRCYTLLLPPASSVLISTIGGTEATFSFPCYIDFLEELLMFEEVLFVCVPHACCFLDQLKRWPQELLLIQSCLHSLLSDCFLDCYELLLRQRLWLQDLNIGFLRMNKLISVGFEVFQQRQSPYLDIIGKIIDASLGWLRSFLTFFYGSSPRPPDVSYVLGFNPLKYTWSSQDHKIFKSKMKVSFHLEGEY